METFHQLNYARTSTIIGLSNIDESFWDEQPDGYPNTVRWNAGHVFVTAEVFLNKADKTYEIAHPDWVSFFIDGTRPSEWNETPPSKDEIIAALKEQEERIVNHFNGKLKKKADEVQTFHALSLDTAEAALQFLIWHEGIHLGIIKSLKLAVKA